MTCVVAVVDRQDGTVYMGSDSAAVDDNLVVAHTPSKVFKVDEFGIGFCHSFRLGQIVQYHFEPPELPVGRIDKSYLMSYMVTKFIPELRRTLELNDYPSHDDEKDSWALLVGVRGMIFIVESDFHVGNYNDNFAAIGAGSEYALGAMLNSALDGFSTAKEGLLAAKYFCPYVIPPFDFIEV